MNKCSDVAFIVHLLFIKSNKKFVMKNIIFCAGELPGKVSVFNCNPANGLKNL